MKKPKSNVKQQYLDFAEKYKERTKSLGNERFLAYLYIIFSLFAISFFGLFAIRPAIATISTLNKQYADNQEVREALVKKLADIKSLEEQQAQLASDLERVENAIPSSPEIPTLTRQIEMLAVEHDVALSKLDFGNIELYPGTKKNDPLFSYSISIVANGAEASINTFIEDLINFERVLTVDRVITGRSERNQNAFQSTIGARAYYFKE